MKFSTRKDLDLPVEVVFDTLSNFAAFERAARRRGAEVVAAGPDAAAPAWQLRFPLRGRMRALSLTLDRIERPEAMRFVGESRSFDIRLDLTLIALARARTRLGVELEVRPRTLSGRLLLQSMRIAKAGHVRRFEAAVESFAGRLERNRLAPGA
jgi:hypothetical protein